MTAAKAQTKDMNLGVKHEASKEVQSKITAAREVARAGNLPTNVYPQGKGQPDAAPSAAAPAANVTPLPPPAERKARGPRPAPVRRYSVDLPVYAIKDIHNMAFREELTKKQVILKALRDGGLDIKDIDINERTPDA